MKKYVKIAYTLFKLNLSTILVYRLNIFLMTILAVVFGLTRVLTIAFLFENLSLLEGYSREEMLVIMLMTEILWLLHMLFSRKNLKFVSRAINNGNLDYYLSKPVKFSLLVPFINLDLRQVGSVLPSLLLLTYFLRDYSFSWFRLFGAVFFLLNGLFIFHCFVSIFVSFTFWSSRNIAIHDFTSDLQDLCSLPRDFFFGSFRWIFTFILPLSVIVNPSFQILFGRASNSFLFLSLCISLLFYLINRVVWKLGLKNYSSAN